MTLLNRVGNSGPEKFTVFPSPQQAQVRDARTQKPWLLPPYLTKGPAHLVNEGGEPVVEGLDLLPFLGPDLLDLRVNLHVEWRQQALIDGDLLNPSSRADREASTTPSTKGAPESKAKAASPQTSSSPKPSASPAPSRADGDALVSPEVAKASATEAPGAGSCAPRHGDRAENRLLASTYDG